MFTRWHIVCFSALYIYRPCDLLPWIRYNFSNKVEWNLIQYIAAVDHMCVVVFIFLSFSLSLSTFPFILRVWLRLRLFFYSILSHFWSRAPCVLQQPQSVFKEAYFCRFQPVSFFCVLVHCHLRTSIFFPLTLSLPKLNSGFTESFDYLPFVQILLSPFVRINNWIMFSIQLPTYTYQICLHYNYR